MKKLGAVNTMITKFGAGDLTERMQVEVHDELDETVTNVSNLGEKIAGLISEIYGANNVLTSVTEEFTR